jgi:hypothetical protein
MDQRDAAPLFASTASQLLGVLPAARCRRPRLFRGERSLDLSYGGLSAVRPRPGSIPGDGDRGDRNVMQAPKAPLTERLARWHASSHVHHPRKGRHVFIRRRGHAPDASRRHLCRGILLVPRSRSRVRSAGRSPPSSTFRNEVLQTSKIFRKTLFVVKNSLEPGSRVTGIFPERIK